MSQFAILAAFFLFVMAGVTLTGFAFGIWSQNRAAGSALTEPRTFLAQAFQRFGEHVPAAQAASHPLRNLLLSAGYRNPAAPQVFQGIRSASALLFGVAGALVALVNHVDFFAGLIATACAAGFGFELPQFVLKRRIAVRRRRIRRAIPAALDLLVLSLEAGQSLNQAVVDTSLELRQVHPDLSAELWQVQLELRAGMSRADALRELGARSGDPELRKLSNVLVDSERFGTSLGPALRTHAKYLRNRMRQTAQESARKVTVKLIFPVFFLIFPSVLLVTLAPAVLHMMKSFADFTK
jgi:tight adherence protein C